MRSPLAASSRRRKITTTFLAPVAAVGFLVATGTAPAQAGSPECNIHNYYGQGASGTGNYGTADQIKTWSSWNVPNEINNFSDEAVWSVDYNNRYVNDLEVGFFVGAGGGDIVGGANSTNGMVPYYTTEDGAHEADYWGHFLPRNTEINMFAQALSSDSFAYVDGVIDADTHYPIDQPRWGFTQGEVSETTATMGGGSGGDESTVYWINSAGNWEPWTYINTCANSPYWAASDNGTDDFENGGPG